MIFTELRFLVFFALVFLVHWGMTHHVARKVWLLLASFVFYAAWDWRFLGLIFASIAVDYVVGLRLGAVESPAARKGWLLVSLAANLGILGFFKYYNFFAESAVDFLGFLGFTVSQPTLEIVLPVGISFYTFQTLSYSIDIYRRQLEPTRNLLDLALFVAFFPQLVAGPIVRASFFLPQLQSAPVWASVRTRAWLTLFLVGFIKKSCVSDNVAGVVDAYFADPGAFTAASAWLAVILYAVQIYCDFSGYSDMAIATAGLLGYELGPNFAHPYLAPNIREFWQRWHISLSTWLRDYLYVPLGGNRKGPRRTYVNLMLTMLLGGLWHGAAWHFVIWGALHGGALAVHRLWSGWRETRLFTSLDGAGRFLGIALATAFTFYWTCLAWIYFRAPDLASAWEITRAYLFFDAPGAESLDPAWWLLFGLLALAHMASRALERREWAERGPTWLFAVVYGAVVAVALLFVRVDVRPFIYFQF